MAVAAVCCGYRLIWQHLEREILLGVAFLGTKATKLSDDRVLSKARFNVPCSKGRESNDECQRVALYSIHQLTVIISMQGL